MYARLARRLPGYLRGRDTVEEGRRIVADRLAHREENFLATAERCIYDHPASPYLPLLRQAGCELGDLRTQVRRNGLEETLRALRREGVYISFEESKGRQPVLRGRVQIEVSPRDFANPHGRVHLESTTSGSTGPRTRNTIDLDYMQEQSPVRMAIRSAQGLLGLPAASVSGRLPESSGFGGGLRGIRYGDVPERWFVPVLDPPRQPELRFRMAHHYVMAIARLCRAGFPRPEPVRMSEVGTIARWAAEALARRGRCRIDCTPSMALRISISAQKERIDCGGLVFRLAGEAVTTAKLRGIEASGARAVVDYVISGTAGVGAGCLHPVGVNDQHLMTHHLGVVQAPRRVGEVEVDALYFTTLLPSSARIQLNVESDDYGVLERRSCGCPIDGLGLDTHVRDIRSFRKLTAEGVTLVGSDMEHILDTVLPERFGGSALDYQLAEEEDDEGFTRIVLNVSPTVEIEDERALIETVLAGLAKASISADLAGRLWNQAGAMQVRRREPVVLTARGKLLPLHLAHHSRPGARELENSAAGRSGERA